MAKLSITIACGNYDRVRAIKDGRVAVDGCEVNFLTLVPEELFFRAFRHQEFDVCEMSMSSYLMALSRDEARYVVVPVFPSRMFRHSAIYIRTDKGIKEAQDLIGRVVGAPEYQLTAILWARGILDDEYGVPPNALRWRTGGLHDAGRSEKIQLSVPAGTEILAIPEDQTLNELLSAGKIDALISPRAPRCFEAGQPNVGRLFPNFREVERKYFARTRIFPIMHVLGIRRDLAIQHPWLANSLYNAFLEAKNICLEEMRFQAALAVTLPWLNNEIDETVALMGKDYWPYGIEPNRATLEAAVRYAYRHGTAVRQLTVEELFLENTLERYKI